MIIGLNGKARSGKDQFGDYLAQVFTDRHNEFFLKVSFANVLKQMCKEHFELNDDQLWERGKNIREKPDLRFPKRLEGYSSNPSDYWTPREIMQHLGSFYRKINYDYWVYALDKEVKRMQNKPEANRVNNFIITDVRHINECAYVKKNNGVLIKITRPVIHEIHGMDHESETALNDYNDFDITINNDGTLDDLYKAAENMSDAIITMEKMITKGEVYNGK